MFHSTRHPRSGVLKVVPVIAAVLLAGVGFSSAAHAASTKAKAPAQAQATTTAPTQCTAPMLRDDWLMRLDPFVSYPWVPSYAVDSEFRYINDLQREIDHTLVSTPQEIAAAQGKVVTPQVWLEEQPDRYVVHVSGTDVRPSDVKVDVQGQRVTVRYDKDQTVRQAGASGAQAAVEQFDSHFAESMVLGHKVQQQGRATVMQAKDGLHVVLLKVSGT